MADLECLDEAAGVAEVDDVPVGDAAGTVATEEQLTEYIRQDLQRNSPIFKALLYLFMPVKITRLSMHVTCPLDGGRDFYER